MKYSRRNVHALILDVIRITFKIRVRCGGGDSSLYLFAWAARRAVIARKRMRVLGLETSTQPASWSLWDEGGEVISRDVEGQPSQALVSSLAESLPPEARPDLILVGVGPGSFSGIRAAIATALGLAQGWGAEVRPVLSTHAIGFSRPEVSFLGIFTDARREQLFFTAYERGVMTRPPSLITAEELEATLSKCSLAVSTDGLTGVPERVVPKATDLVAWFLANEMDEELPLEPVYLHPPMPEAALS
jgi:tRNA threonylcarbamoyladenosine biosynthesis protein TsaB